MKYTWDESMSTGVPRLDAQHRMLIDKFNEFSEIVESNGEIRAAAEEALDYLQFYAAWHFKQEEELMEKYHCPVAEENKRGHQAFLQEFGDMYRHWMEQDMDRETARAAYRKLGEWVVEHIIHTDTQLRDFAPKEE